MPSGCLNPGEMPAYAVGHRTFFGYVRGRLQGRRRRAGNYRAREFGLIGVLLGTAARRQVLIHVGTAYDA